MKFSQRSKLMSLLPFLQLPSGPKEDWWPLAERLAESIGSAIDSHFPDDREVPEQEMAEFLASISKRTGIQLLDLIMIVNGRYNITLKEIAALETALGTPLISIQGWEDEEDPEEWDYEDDFVIDENCNDCPSDSSTPVQS